MNRLLLYRIAVALHAVYCLFAVITVFPILVGGPDDAGAFSGVPQVVLVVGGLLATAGVVSAYGAWSFQKWGIWLTIVVRALDGLAALPGLLFAPSEPARLSAIAAVVLGIFTIVVLLQRPKAQAVA
jgi:hypothetical protein